MSLELKRGICRVVRVGLATVYAALYAAQNAALMWRGPGTPEAEVKFTDLGLADDREYVVFEFWTQTFLGKSKGSFKAPAQDESNALQVFAIREARPHPWVISTTRHISQGGVSLLDESWGDSKKVLSGKSAVVVGDPYVLTVHLPHGFNLKGATITGEQAEIANQQETAAVRIVPTATKAVEWKMTFAKWGNKVESDSPPPLAIFVNSCRTGETAVTKRPDDICLKRCFRVSVCLLWWWCFWFWPAMPPPNHRSRVNGLISVGNFAKASWAAPRNLITMTPSGGRSICLTIGVLKDPSSKEADRCIDRHFPCITFAKRNS